MKEKSHPGHFRIFNLILLLILLAGTGLISYPGLSDLWNSFHQSRAITGYEKKVEKMNGQDIRIMLKRAKQYNRKLLSKADRFVMTDEELKEYNSMLDISGTGIMGYIVISRINVRLPIYHGCDEKVIQSAIGHMEGSSLPVGGKGCHTVLSGHRGLPSARLFSDIDKLEKGDCFNIQVLKNNMTYKIDQIRVVLPDQMDPLRINPDKDYVTLVTCTPYGINTHRLLVRGHRIIDRKRKEAEPDHKPCYLLILLLILLILVMIMIIKRLYSRHLHTPLTCKHDAEM